MLVNSLLTALMAGLAFDIVASPISHDNTVTRRRIPESHLLHESHAPHLGQRWTKKAKVPADTILPVRIGLTQSRLDAGHDKLMDISNPESPNYGKHMTSQEVIDFFAPRSSTVDAVIDWLHGAGIPKNRISLSTNKQWIQFDATTSEVEELLFADFHVWEHLDGSSDLATESYHIPAKIQEHVDYVTPGIRLRSGSKVGRNKKRNKKRSALKDKPVLRTKLSTFPRPNSTTCSRYVTADCTRAQYDIPKGRSKVPGNELGIYEAVGQHYSRNDLNVFFKTLYPDLQIPAGTYPEERLIDGAIGAFEDLSPPYLNDSEVGYEASLDFDAAWPLIWPQGTVLFQEDDEYYAQGEYDVHRGLWNNFLDAIDGSYCNYTAFGEKGNCKKAECRDPSYPDNHPGGYTGNLQCGVYKPTNVISVSYGVDEANWPGYYMKRQCSEWMKLALQGTTTVVASGDTGVGDGLFCPTKADGTLAFLPQYASACPYVLSVGGTEWNRFSNDTAEEPYEVLNEVATKNFGSGGGFSNVFEMPVYQADHVNRYVDTVGETLEFESYSQFLPNGDFSNITSGSYNRLGRAYPDVSAVAERQIVLNGGEWTLIGGTSLSAPVWAAVLTLINEERLKAGKPTLGFVNPALYANPHAFNDITEGRNPGCGSFGFKTSKGWDPVTGLGSPNFPKLLKVLRDI
ncbi:subtilisin-like protein [Poronia punctata]|nr:subtilisin-like protein [Poronia punctata]